jgi:serine/threonine protein kinase
MGEKPGSIEAKAGVPAGGPGGRRVGGRYTLQAPVGRGGAGVVWSAHDELLHRRVAVKEVLLPESLSAEDQVLLRERVLREARAAARLHHPGLVTLFDVVEEDGRPYLVMEYVDAPSLATVIRQDGPLPPERVAGIGLGLLAALTAVHREGVLHRDVKPGNVLLGRDGRVRLTDFGIASVAGDPALTMSGVLLGSPSYIPPERARGRAGSAASDLWSLGATLFTAVEGVSPYEGGTPVEVLMSVVEGRRRPLRRAGRLAPLLADLLDRPEGDRPDVGQIRSRLQAAAVAAPAYRDEDTVAMTRAAPAGTTPTAANLGTRPAEDPPETARFTPPPATRRTAAPAGPPPPRTPPPRRVAAPPSSGRGRRLLPALLGVVALRARGHAGAGRLRGDRGGPGDHGADQPAGADRGDPHTVADPGRGAGGRGSGHRCDQQPARAELRGREHPHRAGPEPAGDHGGSRPRRCRAGRVAAGERPGVDGGRARGLEPGGRQQRDPVHGTGHRQLPAGGRHRPAGPLRHRQLVRPRARVPSQAGTPGLRADQDRAHRRRGRQPAGRLGVPVHRARHPAALRRPGDPRRWPGVRAELGDPGEPVGVVGRVDEPAVRHVPARLTPKWSTSRRSSSPTWSATRSTTSPRNSGG